MGLDGMSEDAAGVRMEGAKMFYRVGAEQLEQVPSLAHRPYGVFRSARTASGYTVGRPVYGVAPNASKPVRDRAEVSLAAGGPTLDARGTSREVLHRDDWVRVMGARRDEEWAPPVRLRRWGSS
jgi:hypothetical protein